ncbi:MAG: response regulator [Candidatus Aenigmarchaeota archaeon]|nr:response regulator [Candidatus Aenigmarchaeota archaeon]
MPKTIMIVDDEADIQELVCAILEPEGFNMVSASDGNECLDKLKTLKPDLILLDMMMPGISGRETCKKIRANPKTNDIKVAFLTVAKFSESGQGILEKMNISDYITKPFDNLDFVKRVKNIVGN